MLVRALAEREVGREYLALCLGVLTGGGTIDEPIGRHRTQRTKMTVRGDGREAITHYRIEQRYRAHTLLRVQLETGRTHQIRVHMKHIGHTLFGDFEHGGDHILKGTTFAKYKQFVQNCLAILPRQGLHARSLGFNHPRTGEWMQFEKELPTDMQQVIERWRNYISAQQSEA